MREERSPKFTFAPTGYRADWQHAPRASGLAYGSFREPLWRRIQRIAFWTVVGFTLVILIAIGA